MGRISLTQARLATLASGFWVDEDYPDLAVRVRENGTRTFYVVWREPYGKSSRQVRKALPNGTRLTLRTARKEAEKIGGLIASNDGVYPEDTPEPETLGALFDAYRNEKETDWRPSTQRNVRTLYTVHIGPAFRTRLLHRLSRKDVIVWARSLPTVATRKRAVSVLNQFFNWCVDTERFAGPNPCARLGTVVPMKLTPTELRGMTLEEVRRYGQELPAGTSGDALRFLALSGLRANTLRQIEWSDVDLKARCLRIPASKMKGKRPFTKFLGKHAIEILMRQDRRRSPYIFPRYDGKMHGLNAWKDTSDRAIEAAGIQGRIAPRHVFRKTLASIGNERGLPKPTLKLLLDHSSGDVTDVYVEVSESHLRDVEERLQARVGELLASKPAGGQ